MQLLLRNKRVLMFFGLALFFVYMGFLAHSYAQAQRFGDEVGHFIGGHFLLKGQTIYRDLQFNHQPLVYYFSAFTEGLTSPQNLYYYIARQRVAIFIYGALWIAILTYLFGWRALIFGVIFEMSKYAYQGYKLLAETIAVYPAVYFFILMMQVLIYKKQLTKTQLILASFSMFILLFSITQIWPFAFVAGLMIVSQIWRDRKSLMYFIAPGLVLTLLFFSPLPFGVPFNDYIREAFTYNIQYFFPSLDRTTTPLQTIIFPFLTLMPPYKGVAHSLLALGTCALIVYSLLSFRTLRWKLLLIVIALVVINTRADVGWYDSFHLLPWVGALLITDIYLASYVIETYKKKFGFITKIHIIGFVALALFLFTTIPNPIQAKQNSLTENYNNYSYSESYGRVVKILRDEGDTLLVIENDPIVYWVGDIKNATHVLEYYSWVLTIPEYSQELSYIFETAPPTFILNTGFINEDVGREIPTNPTTVEQKLARRLKDEYIAIKSLSHNSQTLYLHKSKLHNITDDERRQVRELLFEIPEL